MAVSATRFWDFEWFRRTRRNRAAEPPPRARRLAAGLLFARLGALWVACWAPLLLLSARDGHAMKLLSDWPTHVQLLFSLMLLVLAEPYIGANAARCVTRLREGELLGTEHRDTMEAIFTRNARRQDWVVVHAVLLAVAIAISAGTVVGAPESPWKEHEFWSHEGQLKTAAGQWYLWVSLPLYRFLLLRWFWRLACWAWVLVRVSRLPLRFTASHPDQVGGLGVFVRAQTSAWPLVLAIAINGAAHLAAPGGAEPTLAQLMLRYVLPLAALGVVSLWVLFTPLFAFASRLAAAKRHGLHLYSDLATRLGHELERRDEMPREETAKLFEGLSVLFDATDRMRPLPITRTAVFTILLAAAAPLVPVLVTDHRVLDTLGLLSHLLM